MTGQLWERFGSSALLHQQVEHRFAGFAGEPVARTAGPRHRIVFASTSATPRAAALTRFM